MGALPLKLTAIDNRWVSPNGGGDGLTSTSPATFTMALVNGWLGNTGLTDLRLYFKPGDYEIGHYQTTPLHLEIVGGTGRSVSLIGLPENGVKPRLWLGSIQNFGTYHKRWTKSIAHHWLIRMKGDGAGASTPSDYLNSIVIEDLDLDGNFTGQDSWTSEANATGYKSSAIQVAAKTGRIRNVTVRSFGSVGDVPASVLHVPGGVEAFPVNVRTFVHNPVQAIPAGNSHPWVIENVEVSDFHSVHGGYATMIMPECFQLVHGAPADSPIIAVRRCRVLGNDFTIAFGTAGRWTDPGKPGFAVDPTLGFVDYKTSGRILFQDNLVQNAVAGFNTDTGPIGPLKFDNNVFLDVANWGWMGVSAPFDPAYPLSENNASQEHQRYALTDNLVRLRGWPKLKTWSDVCVSDEDNSTSDPNLALGRWQTFRPDSTGGAPGPEIEGWPSGGLFITGSTGPVELSGNDFTTWPLDNFYLPSPGTTANPGFRLVWKLLGNTQYACWLWPRARGTVKGMTLGATSRPNRLAGVPLDFSSFTDLPGPITLNPFDQNSPTAFPYTEKKPPVATPQGGFAPLGRLGHIHRYETTDAVPRLTGVQEVQIGSISYDSAANGGTLTVKVRDTWHQLRGGSGTGATGTLPVNTPLRLKYERTNPDGSVTAPAASSAVAVNGVATFTFTGLNVASGVCRFTAWQDVIVGGTSNFEPDHDIWATYDYPLNTNTGSNLPVVELTTTVDVGDDKNTAAAKRAKIQATRSFATASSLQVKVTLPTGLYLKPAVPPANTDLTGTYGTTGSADYYIVSGTGTWSSTGNPNDPNEYAITIPAGLTQTTGEVQVITRADNLTEQNLIVCRLVPDSAHYAPGISSEVRVLIFDGPEWTLMEAGLGYTIDSELHALNEVDGANQPSAAGYGTYRYYYNGGPPNGLFWVYPSGGYWSLPNFYHTSTAPVVYQGISTSPLKLVGTWGNNAHLFSVADGSLSLPHLPWNGGAGSGPSTAWGIKGNATVIAGTSRNATPTVRPVAWTGSGTSYTALDVGGALDPAWAGKALAVQGDNQVAGEMYVAYTGPDATSGSYAFRTAAGAAVQAINLDTSNGNGAILHAPGMSGNKNRTAQAMAVSSTGTSPGAAVGWYLSASGKEIAAYWPPSPVASDAGGIDLKAWQAKLGDAADTYSKATGVNVSGWIVGWSGSSGTTPVRAVLKRAATDKQTDWQDLNDRHFVHGASGWVLHEATAINNTGHIVGNGYNGSPRGFVLIPRTAGN